MIRSTANAIVLAGILVSTMTPAGASTAFNPVQVHDRTCMSGLDAEALVRSQSGRTADLRQLALAGRHVPVTINQRSPDACKTSPMSEQLQGKAAIPASIVLGIVAVRSYQGLHLEAAKPTVFSSNVRVVAYDYSSEFAVVTLSTDEGAGGLELGCRNQVSYRVTINTLKVYPFDGCVEAHVHTLPTFSELPPNG